MQPQAGAKIVGSLAKIEHRCETSSRFTSVKDSRNQKSAGTVAPRRVLYTQTRVAGEKSARKISLEPHRSSRLSAPKWPTSGRRTRGKGRQRQAEANTSSPTTPGSNSRVSKDRAYSGKKPRTIAREDHSLVHWIAAIPRNVRLDIPRRPWSPALSKPV